MTEINFETMTKEQIKELLITEFNLIGAEAFDKKDQLIAVYNALSKKVADKPKEPLSVSNKVKMQNRTEVMKEKLRNEPTVRIMIPLDGEPKGSYQEFIVNGARYNVMKGVFVEVPQTIADMFEQSVNETNKAGEDKLANRDEEHAKFCGMN